MKNLIPIFFKQRDFQRDSRKIKIEFSGSKDLKIKDRKLLIKNFDFFFNYPISLFNNF